MLDDVLVDPAAIDRDVRRAAERLARVRAGLGTADGRERARATDPFEGLRHVAGQSTYRALAALEPSPANAPHRDALLRWVHELLQARIGWELELDDADAQHAEEPRLGARAPRGAGGGGSGAGARAGGGAGAEDGVARTFAAAWSHVLDRDPREGALERAAELAPPVAAARKERRARRFEAARRLGLAHPFALATPAPFAELQASARALLEATEPIATHVLREAARARVLREGRAIDAIHLALAKEAREGWPARLSTRWLADAFGALAPGGSAGSQGAARVSPRVLPRALGGASFLRAAAAWGAALRASYAPRGLPFALAFDPYPTAELRFGFALAIATADPAFQRRALGLPSRMALAQARHLRVSLLLAARTSAARLLLAGAEDGGAAQFEELGARAFGSPLPDGLRGAWPEPRATEPSRFAATLSVHAFVTRLRDRFDEDWFANPKAGAHLAQMACAPAWDPDAPDPDGAAPRGIARAFEEALG